MSVLMQNRLWMTHSVNLHSHLSWAMVITWLGSLVDFLVLIHMHQGRINLLTKHVWLRFSRQIHAPFQLVTTGPFSGSPITSYTKQSFNIQLLQLTQHKLCSCLSKDVYYLVKHLPCWSTLATLSRCVSTLIFFLHHVKQTDFGLGTGLYVCLKRLQKKKKTRETNFKFEPMSENNVDVV